MATLQIQVTDSARAEKIIQLAKDSGADVTDLNSDSLEIQLPDRHRQLFEQSLAEQGLPDGAGVRTCR